MTRKLSRDTPMEPPIAHETETAIPPAKCPKCGADRLPGRLVTGRQNLITKVPVDGVGFACGLTLWEDGLIYEHSDCLHWQIADRDKEIELFRAAMRSHLEAPQGPASPSESATGSILELNRKRLQELRGHAESESSVAVSSHWRRAWEALSDAADRLDAMFARCEERSVRRGESSNGK